MEIFEIEVFRLFALAFTRFSGLLVSAPVLGSRNFPARAKAGLAVLCGMATLPTLQQLEVEIPSEAIPFALMAVGELAVGLILGFVMTLTFAAIQVAGQIIDMLTGFGLVNVFNPALETQVPIFGFFLFVLAALVLLALDRHLVMFQALGASFRIVPPGEFLAEPALLESLPRWGARMFYAGLLIAAPVGGGLLLAYATLGMLGRVVPQIHLFVVGFPITIGLGLLLMSLFVGVYVMMLEGLFDRMLEDAAQALELMR
jgi:flagellar biosynthetic protein FliR